MTGTDIEIVEEDRAPTDLMLLTPHSLSIMAEQRKLFLDFVKSQMIEGVDYGRFDSATKDTLLKPGAEKLCRLFGLGFRIKDAIDTIEKEPAFAMASRTIEVYSLRTGKVLSECQGSQNSFEPQFRKKHPLAIVNTLQKMAQKRAFVGAVLSATGASELFNQDLDDGAEELKMPIIATIEEIKKKIILLPAEKQTAATDFLVKADSIEKLSNTLKRLNEMV